LNLAHWDIPVEFYKSAKDALANLKRSAEEIFLIISDMNMKGMSGLDLKKAIDGDKTLSEKAIPFIFASSSSTEEQIAEAYRNHIQGFFTKPISLEEQADILNAIICYWGFSTHPKPDESC
jgi:CheY-like chemotaxis protein